MKAVINALACIGWVPAAWSQSVTLYLVWMALYTITCFRRHGWNTAPETL